MKVGIIVYSQTGNTLNVAKQIQEVIVSCNHSCEIKPIEVFDTKTMKLKTIPSAQHFDLILFASPVQGFSLSRPMATYLSNLAIPENQKVGMVVTQYLSKDWMGGSHAIKQMRTTLTQKHAIILGEDIIHYYRPDKDQQIKDLLERIKSQIC